MFDHVAPTVFWPLFALACLLVTFVALALFTRWIDRSNPYANMKGRAKMAKEWRKPDYFPGDWE